MLLYVEILALIGIYFAFLMKREKKTLQKMITSIEIQVELIQYEWM